jgi:large subunit ribosomal protein L6
MSRIGRKPIKIPEKVKVILQKQSVHVEGPRGKLSAVIPAGVTVAVEGSTLNVGAPDSTRSNRGFQGLMRALIQNMVDGVVTGYQCKLEVKGVGYKFELKGTELVVSAGYSHVVRVQMPVGIKFTVDKSLTKLSVDGNDKAQVFLTGAKIRSIKKPEPYKGKGIMYAGEVVRRKVGKTGAK